MIHAVVIPIAAGFFGGLAVYIFVRLFGDNSSTPGC